MPVDPRTHTAEHLLSAVMRRSYGAPPPRSTHLDSKNTRCDYDILQPLDDTDIARLEEAVNAEIAADRPIFVRSLPRRAAPSGLDLTKLPADAETIRIVSIDGLDETPCTGDHAARTGEIGRFRIRSLTRIDERTVRVRFSIEPAP